MKAGKNAWVALGLTIGLTLGSTTRGNPSESKWSHEVTVKQLEWQQGSGPDALLLNVDGWVGTARNRLWLRNEGGKHVAGAPRDNRLELLWGHPTAWWEWLVGIRHDTGTTPTRTYGALGVLAQAPLGIRIEATGYVGHGSRDGNNVHAGYRLQAERDWLLGSHFTLGTRAEYELWSEDHVRYSEGVGPSGWSGGVRLGYALGRNIAPYVGAEWFSFIGDTATLASQAGESERETRLVAGLRLRF